MAFTIRIELHNASSSQYAELATKLANVGITDTIRGDDGVLYRLPPAEYNNEAGVDLMTVRTLCAGIAASVAASSAVLVTEGTRRAWNGLQRLS